MAIAMIAAAALASSGSDRAPAQVSAQDNFFDPQRLTIDEGAKVRWTNDGDVDHTVKFKGKEDNNIAPGQSYTQRFGKDGSFKYVCTLHSGMDGKVVVK